MTNSRFASIGGILNRTAATAEPEPAVAAPEGGSPRAVAAAMAVAEPKPPISQRPTTAIPRPHSTTSKDATGGVRRIAFRLDPDLHAALAARGAADQVSHGEVVLDSVEAAHSVGILADLAANSAAPKQPQGLFPRLASKGPIRPTVPVEIRLDARAVAILDRLVEQYGAQSRTQLIVAALRHHLDGPGRGSAQIPPDGRGVG